MTQADDDRAASGHAAWKRFRASFNDTGWCSVTAETIGSGTSGSDTTGDAGSQLRAIRLTVFRTGDFAAEYFAQDRGVPRSDWRDSPYYFVFLDRGSLIVSDPGWATFQSLPMPELATKPPGPIQWLFCPWPNLDRIGQWMDDAQDRTITATDSGWRVSSPSCQLSLEFVEPGRLVEVRRILGGPDRFHSIRFEYDEQAGATLRPTVLHEVARTGVFRDGREVGANVRYHVTQWSDSSSGQPAPAMPDPFVIGRMRHDAATADVYDAGGALLYNLNERAAAVEASLAPRSGRTWMYLALGVAVAGSIILALRRWTGRVSVG